MEKKSNDQKTEASLSLDRLAAIELKEMISGLNAKEVEKIKLWLSSPEAFAEEISEIVPISIQKLVEDGSITTDSLLPIVEEAIESSVMANPQRLANVLFPIMGPAIRKAVSEDMKRLIASINSSLESGLSPKRFLWRIQSIFSQRSFAEIALIHNLIYRVKQVFLIHKETGILLQHLIDESESYRDPDMVSAMLTAINDFVKDSFDLESTDGIQTIQIGDNTLWIEAGPYAVIAGIVEGNPPEDLRELFRQSLEEVHLSFGRSLSNFEGDTDLFESDTSILSRCLQKQIKAKKKRKPFILIFLFIILILAGSYWAYLSIEEQIRWKAYITELKHTDGLILNDYGKRHGELYVTGLRDPLSINPLHLVSKFNFDTAEISSNWQYYVSIDEPFVVRRANKKFKPTEEVSFSFRDGILFVHGDPEVSWLKMVGENYMDVWGVDSLNTDHLKVPNIQDFIEVIENEVLEFEYQNLTISNLQLVQIEKVALMLNNMIAFSNESNQFHCTIIGFTTDTGNLEGNKNYIRRRVDLVYDALIKFNVPDAYMKRQIEVFDPNNENAYTLRSVTFKIAFTKD